MDQQELEKLKAVLPSTLELVLHGPDAPCIYDRELEDVYPIRYEPNAAAALNHVMGRRASAGRKRATQEMQKQLRDLLGLTHSLNDLHARIGALNTRLNHLEEMHQIGETPDAAAPIASRSRSSGGTGSQEPRPEEAASTESN